jgi:hypothetical protein
MKTLGLSLLFFFCAALFLVSASAAQTAPVNNIQPAEQAQHDADLLAAPVAGGATDRLVLNSASDLPDSSKNSCAFMRTYRVRRPVRGSDAVVPSGYTKCVPMRRFEMRSTVERQNSPDSSQNSGEK